MMHRQYSDQVFKDEAKVFIRNYQANQTYKKTSIDERVIVRGKLSVAIDHDQITELGYIADMLTRRIDAHDRNLQSGKLILIDLMEESRESSDTDVLKLRGEIRDLLKWAR